MTLNETQGEESQSSDQTMNPQKTPNTSLFTGKPWGVFSKFLERRYREISRTHCVTTPDKLSGFKHK